MALLFIDSFDHYVTADLIEKYTSAGSVSGTGSTLSIASSGRHSSNAFRWVTGGSPTTTGSLQRTLVPADATAVVGVAFRTTGAPGTLGYQLLAIRDASVTQIYLRLNTDLTLSVLRGSHTSGAIALGTTTAALSLNTYAYLELKVLIANSGGTIGLCINGVSVLSLTSQDTQQTAVAGWNAVSVGQCESPGSSSANCTFDYDDLYVLDGSGSAPWNTFLGDVRVDARYPTAEGANAAWTPLSGTDNALMVDEVAPDDNTTYNATGTVGATDTHVVQDAPVAGATIYGVQHCLSMAKSDAGVCQIAPVIRHGSTDYVGAAIAPSTSYAYGLQIAQVNPGTSAQWAESDFNSAEFGYKRTT